MTGPRAGNRGGGEPERRAAPRKGRWAEPTMRFTSPILVALLLAAWCPAARSATAEVCVKCHVKPAEKATDHRVFDVERWEGSVHATRGCTTCHNGTTSTGKPSGHVSTSAQCDECHSTIAWLPANFNHDQVTGSCSSCHNGTTAIGKPGGHFVTGMQCDECHTTNFWIPIDFRHSSPAYPGDHSGNLLCAACHKANSEVVTWSAPAYVPDCAACHANDFKPGPHKKYENPDTFYSISDLRDCSGSCHIYTDSGMTSIKKNRPGPEHRTTNGDF